VWLSHRAISPGRERSLCITRTEWKRRTLSAREEKERKPLPSASGQGPFAFRFFSKLERSILRHSSHLVPCAPKNQ
jgi:hypothetical protein